MPDPRDLTGWTPLADLHDDDVLPGQVGDAAAMLVKWTDDAGRVRVSALAAACTHRGAALPTGLRVGNGVHCPFHHACFDVRSGEAVLAPAIEPLRRWAVEQRDDAVRVVPTGPRTDGPAPSAERVVDDRGVERVVVVGSGAGGFAAVERLRRVGYAGTITLVVGDEGLPVDRTKLSKEYLAGTAKSEDLPLVPERWYTDREIVLEQRSRAQRIDLLGRLVVLEDGRTLPYDALVLATGSAPARPSLPGFDRPEVHLLRTAADATALLDALTATSRVAIVGSGFIGLEAAASLRGRGVDVTVVAPSAAPLTRQLGDALGGMVKALHIAQGVVFVRGTAAAWNGSELQLDDGRTVAADTLLLGLGVTPRTELAEAAGLEVDDGVIVDRFCETSHPGVFAVGDIARLPDPLTGRSMRIEHWAHAERSGALAAINLLGGEEPYLEPPFFWTKQFSAQIRMSGHARSTRDAEVDGDLGARTATVRFTEDGRVTAVAGVGRDHEVLELEQRLLRDPA